MKLRTIENIMIIGTILMVCLILTVIVIAYRMGT